MHFFGGKMESTLDLVKNDNWEESGPSLGKEEEREGAYYLRVCVSVYLSVGSKCFVV